MSRRTKGRTPLTDEIISEILSYKEKTGWGIEAILKWAEDQTLFKKSKSLNVGCVQGWLSGKIGSVFYDDYLKVIDAYKSLPPVMWGKARSLCRRKKRVAVSEGFRAQLSAMLTTCRLSRELLLKLNDAPPDLCATKLGRIINGKTLSITEAQADFLERLIISRDGH